MKKIIGIIAGILLLILVALIALPMIFRDDIIAWIKTDVNKNFTATVDFADVDISLIRSFPQMSVGLRGLTVVNHEPFAGDTLAVIDNLEIALQLSSLWQGGAMVINSILVERPRISVMVNSDGAMNTNIVKPNPEQMTA
ncbi:MAG: AsmA family protein, partial [Calditrichia bacterium]